MATIIYISYLMAKIIPKLPLDNLWNQNMEKGVFRWEAVYSVFV